ncbi:hypothetical protein PF010_g15734 [Phytophthora fragariae]|nr:hypothetical protein PF003_g21699 [Phytophthora fragariae]KAE9098005.1 hypothetical protein PF010_g15734 [Phytophthora fragariae]KAE9217193.1 hypothetical protein PF002_g16871 [Phytophthora fragariae]KAE9334448.1 hypothetical protein PF008_g13962 [Phytophthora fragariae]
MVYVLRASQGFTSDDAPAIAIAAYSARFGRHGLSIMHYKRVDRAPDSGRLLGREIRDGLVTPPPAPACISYVDLLGAVQGLASFANANWHERIAHVLYRVRKLVTPSMDAALLTRRAASSAPFMSSIRS